MDEGLSAVHARVLRHARRICPRDPAIEPEDLVQSAWVKVAPHLANLPTDLDRTRLLMRAVNQVAIDHLRRGKARGPVVPLAEWHAAPDNPARVALARVALGAVLARDDRRTTIAVLAGCGYEQHEIAARLGLPLGTVQSGIARWRAAQMEA